MIGAKLLVADLFDALGVLTVEHFHNRLVNSGVVVDCPFSLRLLLHHRFQLLYVCAQLFLFTHHPLRFTSLKFVPPVLSTAFTRRGRGVELDAVAALRRLQLRRVTRWRAQQWQNCLSRAIIRQWLFVVFVELNWICWRLKSGDHWTSGRGKLSCWHRQRGNAFRFSFKFRLINEGHFGLLQTRACWSRSLFYAMWRLSNLLRCELNTVRLERQLEIRL